MLLRVLLALVCASALVFAPASVSAEPSATVVSQFSGKPVPRFESLRYSAVHGRQGPSLDHPILWRYERQGLPMLVVRETHGWRRVRDQDGDEVWVQARMLSDQRTVILLTEQVLRRSPETTAKAKAMLESGVVAQLNVCQPLWCELSVGNQTGWVERGGLWGVETSTDGL